MKSSASLDKSSVPFPGLSIGKKLGAGMFGTTYLAEYTAPGTKKSITTAYKIQHISEEAAESKGDYKYEIHRELDLYKYINKLPESDAVFFTRLLDHKIFKCDHRQERPWKAQGSFAAEVKKIDASPWCLGYITEYRSPTTLYKYLNTVKYLTVQELTSLQLQICRMIQILQRGGYSHNDLHAQNIIICHTSTKYFTFADRKIPYHGKQLIAIDYGNVLHAKFGKFKGSRKMFLQEPKLFNFMETFWGTFQIISGISRDIALCRRKNKKLPWEHTINIYDAATKRLMHEYPDFYHAASRRYLSLFPEARPVLEYVERKYRGKKEINKLVDEFKKISVNDAYWNVINRVIEEFRLAFPDRFAQMWKFCGVPRPIIKEPHYTRLSIELLACNTVEQIHVVLLQWVS